MCSFGACLQEWTGARTRSATSRTKPKTYWLVLISRIVFACGTFAAGGYSYLFHDIAAGERQLVRSSDFCFRHRESVYLFLIPSALETFCSAADPVSMFIIVAFLKFTSAFYCVCIVSASSFLLNRCDWRFQTSFQS